MLIDSRGEKRAAVIGEVYLFKIGIAIHYFSDVLVRGKSFYGGRGEKGVFFAKDGALYGVLLYEVLDEYVLRGIRYSRWYGY